MARANLCVKEDLASTFIKAQDTDQAIRFLQVRRTGPHRQRLMASALSFLSLCHFMSSGCPMCVSSLHGLYGHVEVMRRLGAAGRQTQQFQIRSVDFDEEKMMMILSSHLHRCRHFASIPSAEAQYSWRESRPAL